MKSWGRVTNRLATTEKLAFQYITWRNSFRTHHTLFSAVGDSVIVTNKKPLYYSFVDHTSKELFMIYMCLQQSYTIFLFSPSFWSANFKDTQVSHMSPLKKSSCNPFPFNNPPVLLFPCQLAMLTGHYTKSSSSQSLNATDISSPDPTD